NITHEPKHFVQAPIRQNPLTTLPFTFHTPACSRPTYGINLPQPQQNDVTQTLNPIQVPIHPNVVQLLNTFTLHYLQHQQGARLLI
ncbi:adhesin, partial [Bacillus cereus]|uniref:adhesin n=1 Tax=Bacillus cereus TaxID=1396 RepID=UPI001C92C013